MINFDKNSNVNAKSGLVFEQTALHDTKITRPSAQVRINDTIDIIPKNCNSILEVGCGNGAVLNKLDIPLAFGTDLVLRGLALLEHPSFVSSIFDLPVADNCVDVVLCAETIEHLKPQTLFQAAAELTRVAKRYVIITVPNEENLLFFSHQCPKCNEIFHINGHMSSFGKKDIAALFPQAKSIEFRGSWPVRPFSKTLLKLRQNVFGYWKYTQFTVCPNCENTVLQNNEKKLLYRMLAGLNMALYPQKSKSNWLLACIKLS